MAASIAFDQTALAVDRAERTAIPWYIWLSVIGVTSAMIGGHWDISWHRSIGRDTFWTAPHLAIQLCGIIAGITCGYLILATTFGNSSLRAASVGVLGFRAPIGAFITAWGGFTMIVSAPFDDWWHSAYGLDVKILSPPHVVLAIGMFGVEIGTLVLVASLMNRASGARRRMLLALFLYVAAMILVAAFTIIMEYTGRVMLHSAASYRAVCLLAPITIAMAPRATGDRWAATKLTGIYTVFLLALEWILPLFPAQPKLGPVLREVTHLIPNGFPLLVIVPAFVLDLIRPRIDRLPNWQHALIAGTVFFAIFLAAQWPFATFLNSPAAANAFFGSGYLEYFISPQSNQALYRFVQFEKTPAAFRNGLLIALACAIGASWIGLARGDWLRRVRR
ncbi:MAG TPA: hypothetical protein VKB79_10990 [Bryobacteraceae bacterium]|nr:hypothetical protein [Bryobacteraceae bacterium]